MNAPKSCSCADPHTSGAGPGVIASTPTCVDVGTRRLPIPPVTTSETSSEDHDKVANPRSSVRRRVCSNGAGIIRRPTTAGRSERWHCCRLCRRVDEHKRPAPRDRPRSSRRWLHVRLAAGAAPGTGSYAVRRWGVDCLPQMRAFDPVNRTFGPPLCAGSIEHLSGNPTPAGIACEINGPDNGPGQESCKPIPGLG